MSKKGDVGGQPYLGVWGKLMAQDGSDRLAAYLELCYARTIPPIFFLFTVHVEGK